LGRLSRNHLDALALLAVGAALIWPMQGPNGVQNAHYALVRALASGTTTIDKARSEVGEASTTDVSHWRGHYYSNKAPGLALLCVPVFKALDLAGGGNDPTRTLWVLSLLGCALPAFGLVLLVRRAGDEVAPGYGIVAAVALGLGTLLFPYATVFLSHALSAFLVFAAFALLWLVPPRAATAAGAGVLAGYAVTVEYPNAIAVGLLGLYLVWRTRRAAPLVAYGAGALLGIVPLLLYNWAAFGSPFRISYRANDMPIPDQFHGPSLHVTLDLLMGFPGLLPLAPVVAAGACGLVLVWRAGRRGEAAFAAALALLYVGYNSAFYSPFGGLSPGPRYLITVLPFLLFALAPLVRELPLTSLALALVSISLMTMITATHALAGYDGKWLDRLEHRDTSLTAASLLGITGAVAIVPLFLAVAAALLLAGTGRLRDADTVDVAGAGVVTCAWAFVAATAPGGADAAHLVRYLPGLLATAAVVMAGTYALRAR
jgi:hypothetical protein